MSETVTIRGFVATEPRHLVTEGGLPITSFRLVSTRRRFNRDTSSWEDADTNWYTVSSFRRLASNVAGCVSKGDPVVVSGRLCIREWTGEQRGITAEIEADGIGHDLSWGRSEFTRGGGETDSASAPGPVASEQEAEPAESVPVAA
ncbi:single-stranded DNA-binding protein [Leifsonia sp. AG29]|uniref:single-stranded DNA-binding protein n=1 Tax=Leifsonia sp. AG29 TaxID=2598860 RepID=UPI00131AC3C1|nr:single-stranded DNA-binding protein [Leifsonia sp. AG29]